MDAVDRKSRRLEQEPELTGGEAGGPEVELPLVTAVVSNRRPLVDDPRPGVEVFVRFEEPEREVRGEGGQREPASGSERRGEPGDDPCVVVAAEQSEAALAHADHGVELAVEVEIPDVEHVEPGRQALGVGSGGRERDEVGREIDSS